MSINSLQEICNISHVFPDSANTLLSTEDDSSLFTEAAEDAMDVVAHRGYTKTAPENTLAAFEEAAENGYDTVECDIRWTKDNMPVILHDAAINRTARKQNGSSLFFTKKCSNLTYEQLLQYDFGSYCKEEYAGTKIPTLYETLECVQENDLNLYIELKTDDCFDEEKAQILADALKETGLEDSVTWISFNAEYLEMMREIMPGSRLGYLTKTKPDEETIETLSGLQTGENEVFLDVKYTKISESTAQMLEDAGFKFEVWTVDNIEDLDELKNLGCTCVTTDELTKEDIEEYLYE